MQWEPVIGLEVHVQLKTKSKIFSGAPTAYGASPNTQACAIDLAMPGMLPVLNQEAVNMAIKFGLATHSEISRHSVFARKNYFYPDLPKGYQISQFEAPIVGRGHLNITLSNGETRQINITRAHLEEDAGKSLHEDFQGMSGIDLNRAGTPLLEVVSEPELRSSEEAVAYLKALHALVCYLEICDGNMQEGSFRCDANVSVRPKGQTILGTRTEMKNINSFRYVEQAIEYEIARQIDVLEQGGEIIQQTRLFDPARQETRLLREKEEANDYRYFPDPDLLPLILSEAYIQQIGANLPELPEQKKQRFIQTLGLSAYDATVLTAQRELAFYYEATLAQITPQDPKLVSNWITGEVLAYLNKNSLSITQSPVSPTRLAQLLTRIQDQTISGKIAKTVLETMFSNEQSADTIIAEQGLKQITDSNALNQVIEQVIAQNPQQFEAYQQGKTQLFGYFVGQAMKLTQGKANPKQVNALMQQRLNSPN